MCSIQEFKTSARDKNLQQEICVRMSNIVPKMLVLLHFFLVFVGNSAAHKLPPALYVFGDSTLDVGNNNNTHVKSTLPYGVDYPGNHSGRLTNGYNMADFFAKWLGLELPPPYNRVYGNDIKNNVTEGINYAIVGATIVDGRSGFFARLNTKPLTLGLQVKQFRETVEQYLPTRLTSNDTVSRHLADSIFMLSIGGNDYLLNYLPSLKVGGSLNAVEFADKVVDQLAISLKELYNLGGRKFVITEMGPFGNFLAPRFSPISSLTSAQLNQLALIYNDRLTAKLKELTSSLESSTFVQLKTFKLALDLINNPTKYGLVNSKEPCCQVNLFGGCEPNTAPCSNRTEYVFFDMVHPTEITNKIIAQSCFNGTAGVCVPNVKELAQIAPAGDQGKTEEKTPETPQAGEKTGETPAEEEKKNFFIQWIEEILHKLFGYDA